MYRDTEILDIEAGKNCAPIIQINLNKANDYSDCQNNVPIGARSNCLGMGAYANRRNNSMPFVNGGISASMKSGQPQMGRAHGAVYGIRLYNIYRP